MCEIGVVTPIKYHVHIVQYTYNSNYHKHILKFGQCITILCQEFSLFSSKEIIELMQVFFMFIDSLFFLPHFFQFKKDFLFELNGSYHCIMSWFNRRVISTLLFELNIFCNHFKLLIFISIFLHFINMNSPKLQYFGQELNYIFHSTYCKSKLPISFFLFFPLIPISSNSTITSLTN